MQTSKVKINIDQMLGFRLINNHKNNVATKPILIGSKVGDKNPVIGSKIGGKVGTKPTLLIGSKIGEKPQGIGLIGSKIGDKAA